MSGNYKDPYFSLKRAQGILVGVLMFHAGILIVPLIFAALSDYFDPPVFVMKVGMADLPLGDAPDAGPAPVAQTDPEPVTPSLDEFPDPTKVDPLPDLPPPPPTVEQKEDPPKTEQKKDPPKTEQKKDPPKTEQKKDPPKTEQKKDPPKTEQKKDPPKTEQKKDPPKSTLLKPEDIRKTQKTQAQIDAERKKQREAEEARRKAEAARKAAEDARKALISGIQQDASQSGKFGTPNPGQDGVLLTKEMRAYYDQLVEFIYPRWNKVSPSEIEIAGNISKWPAVDLTIAKDGSISKAVFVSPSGNKKIDDAVKMLLADLKVVPKPPEAGVIRVTLDIH